MMRAAKMSGGWQQADQPAKLFERTRARERKHAFGVAARVLHEASKAKKSRKTRIMTITNSGAVTRRKQASERANERAARALKMPNAPIAI